MSRATGFVRDSRFGPGQVIPGTNRETSKKWRKLGIPDVTRGYVQAGACIQCGTTTCVCIHCFALRKGKCPGCAQIPGHKESRCVVLPDGVQQEVGS